VAQRKASKAKAGHEPATDLEIVRVFDAPRDLVYAMWSTPEHLGKWSAPRGFTIPDARSDFRAGGAWYAHMRSPKGEDHRVEGKYLEIVPGERIVMTHAWLDGAGNPGPETTVSVTFESLGQKTRMKFLQSGFASVAARDGHADGWGQCFDILAELLAVRDVPKINREIVMSRVIAAPPDLVFKAFTDRHHISNWWGPNGFTTTTYEMDVRVGGQWLFTMHGPDGTDYENRVRYTEVRPPEYLAYDHDGGDGGDLKHSFKAVVTFEPDAGKTRVTFRLVCADVAQHTYMAKFGAIEGGYQTLARLDTFLSKE
jgi:uncharacterized protein YndB with AHSA1/START domain